MEIKEKIKVATSSPTTKQPSAPPTRDKCGAKVMVCSCEDAYQDKTYGKTMRVHTKKVKAGKCSGYTCCTCGKTKNK